MAFLVGVNDAGKKFGSRPVQDLCACVSTLSMWVSVQIVEVGRGS
jgi:hypothetical protein